MSNIDLYNEVIRKAFELSQEEPLEQIKRGETDNWDSLGHMNLISELEDSFDIMLDTEDILGFMSYQDGISILKKYGVEI